MNAGTAPAIPQDPILLPDPEDPTIYTSSISRANLNRVTFDMTKPPTYHEFDVSKLPSYMEAAYLKRIETLPGYDTVASKTTSL